MPLPGMQKFDRLRKDYPFLSFEGFESSLETDGLKVIYHFDLSGKFTFNPGFTLPVKPFLRKRLNAGFINSSGLQNLLFHIGMIELISYWKAACPPRLVIKNHPLSDLQVQFWKHLYFHGLGEFFYTNDIDCSLEEFLTLEAVQGESKPERYEMNDSVLVPIGGGKDSIVTLEILRKEFDVKPFILNPRGASLETCFKAGYSNNGIAEVFRWLDPQLLKLNDRGFLNGHTPFSALLAFFTLLISAISGNRHIALSNESSANEPTVSGSNINHQYSKSFEFEKNFRDYSIRFLSPDFNYFSFLRPLNELQIASLFARHVKFYPVFKSCNVGSKTDSWCGKCPKCLFAWIILCPFIPLNELIHLFGKNLFEDPAMIQHLKKLTGIDEVKPFECVGTVLEVNVALLLFMRQHPLEKYPLLIDYYSNTSEYASYRHKSSDDLLHHIDDNHFLPDPFLVLIRQNLI